MSKGKLIDRLTDDTVAKIRTVVPAVWGVIVGQVLTWLIGRGWLPDVAADWQGAVYGATVTVVTGLCVAAVYAAARWVEARKNPVSRFIARLLLVILKQPSYTPSVTIDPDGTLTVRGRPVSGQQISPKARSDG